ncbi:MAG: UDP-N-acetylmuramoyl-L-alanyl-D-glutamate--2,6-diaminopimelate ligase [Patescibacteria group bacterium]
MLLKSLARKLTPKSLLSLYHFLTACVVGLFYGFPGKKLIVIGVTGTKGKSTTSHMIWHILQSAGFKTGLLSTALWGINDKTWLNNLKMTTPSRVQLQKVLRQMVQAGCKYAVVETSSEALAQWRHLGLNYQVGVFTNLTPEHIEAHGSFTKYRAAKGRLFKLLGKIRNSTSIINLDDAEANYFLQFPAGQKIGYGLKLVYPDKKTDKLLSGEILEVTPSSAVFKIGDEKINLPVGGEFNIKNALAAVACVSAFDIDVKTAAEALQNFSGTPGRMEFVKLGQKFDVVVDYAHTAESLEEVYKLLKLHPTPHTLNPNKLIVVLGSCGGGRDKAKRPILGELAGKYADVVFITNEDPYDEDPRVIIEAVAEGAKIAGKILGENLFIVSDRREAIKQALIKAEAGDTVVITGKGSEQWLCVARGQKIAWDDREVVNEELSKLGY